jgi:hypothetical protein
MKKLIYCKIFIWKINSSQILKLFNCKNITKSNFACQNLANNSRLSSLKIQNYPLKDHLFTDINRLLLQFSHQNNSLFTIHMGRVLRQFLANLYRTQDSGLFRHLINHVITHIITQLLACFCFFDTRKFFFSQNSFLRSRQALICPCGGKTYSCAMHSVHCLMVAICI